MGKNSRETTDATGAARDLRSSSAPNPSGPSQLLASPADLWINGCTLALIFAASLITSLFFKAKWLWMDEVLSYQLISDSSVAHLNDALVSGMDANPPLFPNLYWFIGQISLSPEFLRGISVTLFAATVAFFFSYTTRLVGTIRSNVILIGTAFAFTYLNLTLATQIRAYAVFLLIAFSHFVSSHQLARAPRRISLLVAQAVTATLLLFTHNFGLFYLAATTGFFLLLSIGSRDRTYLFPIAAHLVAAVLWLGLWFPSFAIQAAAGKPHSWIPLPTLRSFFHTAGELVPTLSSQLERAPALWILPVLRFVLLLGLFLYLALPRLKRGFREATADPAFLFYVFSGLVYLSTLTIAVAVSFLHTSIFVSRYLWPNHLLLVYQLVYAFHHFFRQRTSFLPLRSRWLLPVYFAAIGVFVFYQNRKVVVFPSGIVEYLARLTPNYPVFVETADYFLPLWFHKKDIPVHYVLDWESAAKPGNILSATVEHQILKSVAEKYQVSTIVPVSRFTAEAFPHFYVVDESAVYATERFLESGRITVLREIPVAIPGHRILECIFTPSVGITDRKTPMKAQSSTWTEPDNRFAVRPTRP